MRTSIALIARRMLVLATRQPLRRSAAMQMEFAARPAIQNIFARCEIFS
jgi:hypothetical protein